jgi:hypothetical protein
MINKSFMVQRTATISRNMSNLVCRMNSKIICHGLRVFEVISTEPQNTGYVVAGS